MITVPIEGWAVGGLALVASQPFGSDACGHDVSGHALSGHALSGHALSGHLVVVDRLLAGLGTVATSVTAEATNTDYGAATCEVGGLTVRLRSGRVTPTKAGLFVAHWRRAVDGSTEPFDAEGSADLLVVTAVDGDQVGAFLFPRRTLLDQGILSGATAPGRRGFRLYPPWSLTTSAQARRTQRWQDEFFVTLPLTGVEPDRARALLVRAAG